MRVLGIDPGYAIVGWGVVEYIGNRFAPIGYGAVITEKDTPFEQRLIEIYEGVLDICKRYQPEALSIEKLYYQHNQTTVIGVAEARGVILLAAAQCGVPIYEYTPMQVKQAITGYGKAVKKQVQEMTRILLQMGAKRIALLVGSTIYAVNTDRTRGYLRGFAESCVPVDQRLVHSGIESAGQTIDALEAALEQKADCLLCGDDEIAYEVMRELRNRHILVPHDLRVASLYDSSMLASITPSVSAVQYDAEQLGRTACRMLLDRLLGKEVVQRQIEGYQVILRESTKWNSRTHDGR